MLITAGATAGAAFGDSAGAAFPSTGSARVEAAVAVANAATALCAMGPRAIADSAEGEVELEAAAGAAAGLDEEAAAGRLELELELELNTTVERVVGTDETAAGGAEDTAATSKRGEDATLELVTGEDMAATWNNRLVEILGSEGIAYLIPRPEQPM